MQSARIALRNIARQKKRTALLGGAIAFGTLVIVLMGSFAAGVLENVRENFTGIFGGHIYLSGQELSPSGRVLGRIGDTEVLAEALRSVDGKVSTSRLRSRARGEVIFGSREESVNVDGVDWQAEAELWQRLGVVQGDRGLLSRENGAILPASVASALGVEVGETVLFRMSTVTGQANVGELLLAGIYPDNQGFNITGGYVALSYLNGLLGLAPTEFQVLNITLYELDEIDAVADRLYRQLALSREVAPRLSHSTAAGPQRMMSMIGGGSLVLAQDEQAWEGTKFSLTTLNDIMEPVLLLVQILGLIRTGLFAVLLAIMMAGLLNTFRMVLIERTQEIGTMRALGMQRGGVRSIFLFEALFLALAGAAAGLAAALALMGILGRIQVGTGTVLQLFTRGGSFRFPVIGVDVAGTAAILALVTVLSAWLPARKAAALKPADALRTTY